MTDLTVDQVVERCRGYWLGSGIDTTAAGEMAAELKSHLQDATAAGKSIESVTGSNLEEFAEEWAAAFRGPTSAPIASADLSPSAAPVATKPSSWTIWAGALAIAALVALVMAFGPKDDSLDRTVWIGTWIVAAALLAIGEMLTAGFFLLPFAIGAGAAALLALASITVAVQVIMFAVISLLSLWLLQQFAKKDIHGQLLPVGAARFVGSSAVVTESINRLHGTGMVRMGTETWRAVTDGDHDIDVNTPVMVTEVRGARLVVEQVNNWS